MTGLAFRQESHFGLRISIPSFLYTLPELDLVIAGNEIFLLGGPFAILTEQVHMFHRAIVYTSRFLAKRSVRLNLLPYTVLTQGFISQSAAALWTNDLAHVSPPPIITAPQLGQNL